METILSRIQKIAETEGITIGALEKQIGASKGVLYRAISNGTDIQSKWIQIIVKNYPLYSTRWLLTGEGTMLRDNNLPVAKKTKNKKEGIPLIPFSAMAGALTSEQTALRHECEHYIIPAFTDADFLITVKGNSMQPTYISGDIVACRKVPLNNIFFQWNKPYVLDTSQGPLIKRIKPATDQQHITLISDNKEFDPIQLPITDINAIALIVGLIRIE